MFGNPIYFIAFITEVIHLTTAAKDSDEPVDNFQILTKAAGRRMGVSVN